MKYIPLQSKEAAQEYSGAYITNIYRGKGGRSQYIYGSIYSAKHELLVSANINYCVRRMEEAAKLLS